MLITFRATRKCNYFSKKLRNSKNNFLPRVWKINFSKKAENVCLSDNKIAYKVILITQFSIAEL